MSEWRDISTAPKRPVKHNGINDFTPLYCGPTVILHIDGFTEPTVGWWEPSNNCWRYMDDDGADDMQPSLWMPLPEAPK